MTPTVGIIGTGRLGGMLIRGFINARTVSPEQLFIYNRTPQKAAQFKADYPGINIANSSRELLAAAEWLFICVKPLDLPGLLAEIGYRFGADKLIVSTLLVPTLATLDRMLTGKIARIYPSITQSTGVGVTLAAFGRQVNAQEKEAVMTFLACLGKRYEVPEGSSGLWGHIQLWSGFYGVHGRLSGGCFPGAWH